MNNARIIIVLCFAAAFGAGLVAGKLWERTALASSQISDGQAVLPPAPIPVPAPATTTIVPQPQSPEPGWLKELNLDAKQSAQFREIWQDAMKRRPMMGREKHEALRKERDDTIKAALTDELRAKQKELNSACDAKCGKLWNDARVGQERERRKTDDSFKAMLNDDQKKAIEVANKTYETKMEEASHDKEWKRTWDEAVAKTRAMLNPDQLVKYDEFRKKHEGPRSGFGPRPDGQRGGPGDHTPGDHPQGDRPPGDVPPKGERGDARDGNGKPLIKPKNGFVLEKVGGSWARVSCPPQATFHA